MSAPKRVVDFRVTCHGVEHEQYFQGHGTALTRWEECATGIGDSYGEALDDALDQIAQNGWDTSTIEADTEVSAILKERNVHPALAEAHTENEECELHVYVSVDVMGADEVAP